MHSRGAGKSREGVPCPGPPVDRVCALDLGSRTFKAIVGERRGARLSTRVLAKRTLELGVEVAANDGVISAAKLAEIRQALLELRELCTDAHGDVILAVATHAVRQAVNQDAFLDTARDAGIEVEVADGEREGVLAYLAVNGDNRHKLVCDFGSQSMQLAWQTRDIIEAHSINGGYERAYLDFFHGFERLGQARDHYLEHLSGQLPRLPKDVDELTCLGMNTMASFVTGRPKRQITDRSVQHATLRRKLAELEALPPPTARRLEAATPKLPKILPGLVLLDYLLERTGFEAATIASTEMATGLIVEYFTRTDDA